MSGALFSLAGRSVLVTGGGRGLGRAMALHLASCGAHVWIGGRDGQRLTATAAEAAGRGWSVAPLPLDLRDVAGLGAAFDTIRASGRASGRKLDILVNNAGTEEVRPSDSVDESLWDRIIDTNLKGAFFAAQHAARLMEGGGCIVNLASLTSAAGVAGAVPYGASKSGIAGMTRALAVEWAPRGIRVNAIGPELFPTDMTAGFFADPDWEARARARLPLGRFGLPQDLAGPLQFLCSDASAYVTGQVFYVDGGILAAL